MKSSQAKKAEANHDQIQRTVHIKTHAKIRL
jgi:hypothetical protein